MNTGTPDEPTPEAIRPYLKQFLSDRNLIDMPPALWQPILNLFILPNRPKRTAPFYRAIWTSEGSPFMIDSLALRDALAARLDSLLGGERADAASSGETDGGPATSRGIAGKRAAVALGMRSGNPSIEAGLRELRDAGADTVVALPLYPQRTRSCAGTCFEEFDRAFRRVFGALPDESDGSLGEASVPRVVRVGHYWDAPGYLQALARSIRDAWEYAPGSKLVVSFHSIPMSHAQAGDPYPEQTLATARALASELDIPRGDVRLTYQSRFDGRTWIGPMLEPMLSRLAKEQVKNVAVVCPGFSVDCLETLHEVRDLAAAHFADECKRFGNEGASFAYIPALGADSALVEVLAHVVARKTGA